MSNQHAGPLKNRTVTATVAPILETPTELEMMIVPPFRLLLMWMWMELPLLWPAAWLKCLLALLTRAPMVIPKPIDWLELLEDVPRHETTGYLRPDGLPVAAPLGYLLLCPS
jgi:hypothetical protein